MRLEDIKEGSMLYCNTSTQDGIHYVYVIEKVKVEIQPDVWDDGVRYSYYDGKQTTESIQHPDQFSQTESRRKPKCYECQLEINENKYKVDVCRKCGWLICPRDKACGCGYRGM